MSMCGAGLAGDDAIGKRRRWSANTHRRKVQMATNTIRTRTAEAAPSIGSGLRDRLSNVSGAVASVFKLYFGPAMSIERAGLSTKDKPCWTPSCQRACGTNAPSSLL